MQLPGDNFLYISSSGIEFKAKNDLTDVLTADIVSISNRRSSMAAESIKS
jgi:hypothetical protein